MDSLIQAYRSFSGFRAKLDGEESCEKSTTPLGRVWDGAGVSCISTYGAGVLKVVGWFGFPNLSD